MNIAYVSNENYAKHLGISLYSLLENNRHIDEIQIYIISIGIQEGSKEKLRALSQIYGRDMEIIECNDIAKKIGYEIDTKRFDISAMGRVFLSDLLSVDKVLYLDCDTLILGDIEALYQKKLKKTLAAVMEPTIAFDVKKDIGMAMYMPYFNTGVLLMDLKKWREKEMTRRVLAYLENIKDRCIFTDQDAINASMVYDIEALSPKYNFFSNYKYWSYEALVKQNKRYAHYPKKEFEKAKKDPIILHFAGHERPWLSGNFNPYRKEYEKYKKSSLWKEEKREKGNRVYLFAYHIMNLLTMISPNLRRRISFVYTNKIRKDKLGK